ncbi:hypothetical protein L6452_14118 [Arctium lappa]|uniref:Uncharacterized protein n=1 Tax=Arctium lappa TaxID=4217 RepID=A0ACB9CK63_ARCLA|nr:hypothetical protein L6452_14118 [Arctium lappa]
MRRGGDKSKSGTGKRGPEKGTVNAPMEAGDRYSYKSKTGEERRTAERTIKLFPVKEFSDAVGVEVVSAPTEMTNNVIRLVIGEADETHLIDGSVPSVHQIIESDGRKIHRTYVWSSAITSKQVENEIHEEIE